MIRAEKEIEKLNSQLRKQRLAPIEYKKGCTDIKWEQVEYLHNKAYSVGKIAQIFGCKAEVIRNMLVEHGCYDNFECKFYQVIDNQKSCKIRMDMSFCGRFCACCSYDDFFKAEPIYTDKNGKVKKWKMK